MYLLSSAEGARAAVVGLHAASGEAAIVKISEIFRPKMARTLKRLLFYIWNLEKFTHRGHNVLKIMYSNMLIKNMITPKIFIQIMFRGTSMSLIDHSKQTVMVEMRLTLHGVVHFVLKM